MEPLSAVFPPPWTVEVSHQDKLRINLWDRFGNLLSRALLYEAPPKSCETLNVALEQKIESTFSDQVLNRLRIESL